MEVNMTTMKFNLFALKRRLELATGKPYTWQQIAYQTDVHFNTIYNLSSNRTRRVDLEILGKLYDFFRREGLEITTADLLTAVTVTESGEVSPTGELSTTVIRGNNPT